MATSCKKEKQKKKLRIDLRSEFSNDNVVVSIDGIIVMNDVFLTNPLLGLCTPNGVFRTDLTEGKHTLEVSVNALIYSTKIVVLDKDLYYVVKYDSSEAAITFLQNNSPFLYD